jgi:hypothetical protein
MPLTRRFHHAVPPKGGKPTRACLVSQWRRQRTIALAIVGAAWLCLNVPVARADIGGNIPGPGLCDYPDVGSSGNVMGGNWFYCDFPTQINGSHRHRAYGIFILGYSCWQSSVVQFNVCDVVR